MRRFYSRRRSGLAKKAKSKSGLKAACLSLGLATAWGGEAAGDVTLKVEITPERTLTDAVILYGNNVSTGLLASLGTAPAGQTTTFVHPLREEVLTHCQWVCQPESYGPDGNRTAFYALIGLYEEAASTGVTVSFPDDAAVETMATWASIFESSPFSSRNFTEPEIIADLLGAQLVPNRSPEIRASLVNALLTFYGGSSLNDVLGTSYGETATLVNFSEASFGGTAVVTVIPEPATWCLLAGATGILQLRRRRDVVS